MTPSWRAREWPPGCERSAPARDHGGDRDHRRGREDDRERRGPSPGGAFLLTVLGTSDGVTDPVPDPSGTALASANAVASTALATVARGPARSTPSTCAAQQTHDSHDDEVTARRDPVELRERAACGPYGASGSAHRAASGDRGRERVRMGPFRARQDGAIPGRSSRAVLDPRVRGSRPISTAPGGLSVPRQRDQSVRREMLLASSWR